MKACDEGKSKKKLKTNKKQQKNANHQPNAVNPEKRKENRNVFFVFSLSSSALDLFSIGRLDYNIFLRISSKVRILPDVGWASAVWPSPRPIRAFAVRRPERWIVRRRSRRWTRSCCWCCCCIECCSSASWTAASPEFLPPSRWCRNTSRITSLVSFSSGL